MREMGSGTLPCSVIPSLPPIVPACKMGASPNPGLPTALPKPRYQDPTFHPQHLQLSPFLPTPQDLGSFTLNAPPTKSSTAH